MILHGRLSETVGLKPVGRITARTWEVEDLRKHIKSWPALSDEQKHERLRELGDELTADVTETENIPLDGLLAFIARGLDPTDASEAEAAYLALGDDTTTPDSTNTELGNEIYRTVVGDADRDGADLLTSTFLSQAEANGETITEVGLAGGDVGSGEPLLTHALFASGDEIEKNSQMVATIDYILEIRGA